MPELVEMSSRPEINLQNIWVYRSLTYKKAMISLVLRFLHKKTCVCLMLGNYKKRNLEFL